MGCPLQLLQAAFKADITKKAWGRSGPSSDPGGPWTRGMVALQTGHTVPTSLQSGPNACQPWPHVTPASLRPWFSSLRIRAGGIHLMASPASPEAGPPSSGAAPGSFPPTSHTGTARAHPQLLPKRLGGTPLRRSQEGSCLSYLGTKSGSRWLVLQASGASVDRKGKATQHLDVPAELSVAGR